MFADKVPPKVPDVLQGSHFGLTVLPPAMHSTAQPTHLHLTAWQPGTLNIISCDSSLISPPHTLGNPFHVPSPPRTLLSQLFMSSARAQIESYFFYHILSAWQMLNKYLLMNSDYPWIGFQGAQGPELPS